MQQHFQLFKKRITNSQYHILDHTFNCPIRNTSNENSIDFVFVNEGVYALHNILKLKNFTIKSVKQKGIAYIENGIAKFTKPENIVPQERMDIDLPDMLDLLPYKSSPRFIYHRCGMLTI